MLYLEIASSISSTLGSSLAGGFLNRLFSCAYRDFVGIFQSLSLSGYLEARAAGFNCVSSTSVPKALCAAQLTH